MKVVVRNDFEDDEVDGCDPKIYGNGITYADLSMEELLKLFDGTRAIKPHKYESSWDPGSFYSHYDWINVTLSPVKENDEIFFFLDIYGGWRD